jgi:glutathione S-transferase
MKLLMTPTSPYARKAHVIILEKGINCEITPASPWENDEQLLI